MSVSEGTEGSLRADTSPSTASSAAADTDGSPASWDRLLLLSDEQTALWDQVNSAIHWLLLPLALLLTVCNVVVFLHPSMASSARFYVVALSVVQIFNLFLDLVSSGVQLIIPNYYYDRGYWIFSIYVAIFFSAVSRRGSYVLMCLLSTERLYAVLRPLHLKTFLLSRRPVLLTVAVLSVTVVLHVYLPAKTYVGAVHTGPRVVYRPLPTSLYLQHKEVNDAFSLLAKVLLLYLPLLCLLPLTVLTVVSLRRHRMCTSIMTSSNSDDVRRRQEHQLTFTIFTATVAYVVLTLPQGFHFFFSTLYRQYRYGGKFNNLYVVVNWVFSNLVILSCLVDFFCFLSTSSSYRDTLRQLVCFKRHKASKNSTMNVNATKFGKVESRE